MKKFKIIILVFFILIIISFVVANTYPMKQRGLIIKIKPLHFAMVFAHGGYANIYDLTAHFTLINYSITPTYFLLKNLKKEGYDKVWISMCQTKKYDFIARYDMRKIYWGDLDMKIYKSNLLGNTEIPIPFT